MRVVGSAHRQGDLLLVAARDGAPIWRYTAGSDVDASVAIHTRGAPFMGTDHRVLHPFDR